MYLISSGKNDWNVALKLDMAKTYNRVDQDFLQAMLARLDFSFLWLRLIAHCTQHCWFLVMVNGGFSRFFKSSRGLRQGNLLSPMLFVLASEYLSRGINKLFEEEHVLGVKIFLDSFAMTTCQCINVSKTSFWVAPNAPTLIIRMVKRLMGLVHKPFPFTYLGASIYVGWKKAMIFEPLIEALASMVVGWEKKVIESGLGIIQLPDMVESFSQKLW
ncbi:UNVERIFIED_CONTAM: hypothetical protein Scaly_0568300 [Sesamum calycinum]|uniref:Reverse transcriptase domain-containing protein n=1 Tax=Sesamum calycinum TaxID=2727403 RepID=A0AAW2RRQ8_9LAMI